MSNRILQTTDINIPAFYFEIPRNRKIHHVHFRYDGISKKVILSQKCSIILRYYITLIKSFRKKIILSVTLNKP